MGSQRVPKLVIKKRMSTRRLKVPEELADEQIQAKPSAVSRRITRSTLALRRAKSSLKAHAALLALGLCAAVIMYGVVATLAAPSEEEAGGVTKANGRIELRDPDDPSIIKVITTTESGTTVKYWREIKKRNGTVRRPIKLEKPKSAVPSDELENNHRDPKELIIQ